MKIKTHIFCFVICLTLLNCKDNKPKFDYQFSEKESILECQNINSKLVHEALYNFETILSESYANNNPNLSNAYRQFTKESGENKVDYNNISTEHSLKIFEALKQENVLLTISNNKPSLNYNHELFKCIADNIQNKDVKTTFNALLSTNSLGKRMMKEVLISNNSRLNSDKYLATYVALEFYYSNLSTVDLSKKENPNLIKNEKDPHAGHNH